MTANHALPKLMTIKEAADYLRRCPKTVRRYLANGELPSIRVGSRKLVRERDLRAYIDRKG